MIITSRFYIFLTCLLFSGCAINQYDDVQTYKDLINLDIGKRITIPEIPRQTIKQEERKIEQEEQKEEPVAQKPNS